jgi:hypothetical protein
MSLRTLVCAALVLALWTQPAYAISDGTPDFDHPNVGAMLLEFDPVGAPGAYEVSCSLSLLSPRHALTAAHCVSWLESEGYSADNLAVTFDQNARNDPATIGVTGYTIHPHAFALKSYPLDMAVLTLASPVVAIDPIELPEPGFLDDQAGRGGLRGHSFVQVGYGWVPNDRGQPAPLAEPGLRLQTTSPFAGLTTSFLKLLANTHATGQGGACFVDSGSPTFYARGSNLALAMPAGGDRWCRSMDKNQRLDLPAARAFLDDFTE